MPNRREMVRFAISKALKDRGLTHQQVAEMLDVSRSSVSNTISKGNFTKAKAARWSLALGIEEEVFLEGKEPMAPDNFKTITESLVQMRQEIDSLRRDVDSLLTERTRQ